VIFPLIGPQLLCFDWPLATVETVALAPDASTLTLGPADETPAHAREAEVTEVLEFEG
jgi:hypothetical protein